MDNAEEVQRILEGLGKFLDTVDGVGDVEAGARYMAHLAADRPELWVSCAEGAGQCPVTWKAVERLADSLLALPPEQRRAPDSDPRKPLWDKAVDAVNEWALKVALGNRSQLDHTALIPPRCNAPGAKMARHTAIAAMVEKIHRVSGLPRTSEYDKPTACGLVAERVGMRADTVRDIWREYGRDLRDLLDSKGGDRA